MNFDDELVDFVIKHEGFRPTPYQDPPNGSTWSIGYGHHLGDKYDPGMTWIEEQAREQLQSDLSNAANGVRSLVSAPLTQGQFNALTSLAFNVGVPKFSTYDVLKYLNSGNYLDAATQMLNIDRAGKDGAILPPLTDRRRGEANLFMGPNAGALPSSPPRGKGSR